MSDARATLGAGDTAPVGTRAFITAEGLPCGFSPEVAFWFERAHEHFLFGEFDCAEIGFTWVALVVPDCALVHYLLALTLLYRGRPDLAHAAVAEAARLAARSQRA